MKDVKEWRNLLQRCFKWENRQVQGTEYIGQTMGWRITLLRVLLSADALSEEANICITLIDYVYPLDSLHPTVTGGFLKDQAFLVTTNYDVVVINESILRK